MVTWFAVRLVASLATVRAAEARVVRLDPKRRRSPCQHVEDEPTSERQ